MQKYVFESLKRQKVKNFEYKRLLWLSLYQNQKLPAKLRRKFLIKLRSNRNASFVRLKNRCLITNRAKSVIRFFQMSRIVFRNYAREGLLTGVKRSSW